MDKFLNTCLIGSLILILGLAGAVTYEYGSKVAPGDTDIGNLLYNFAPTSSPTFKYLDVGETQNHYDEGDVVYLHFGDSNEVMLNDIRITSFDDDKLVAGTKVGKKDIDIDQELNTFEKESIAFLNLHGGPGYSFDDPVYLHIGDPTTDTVTYDIRLDKIDGLSAGTQVLDFNGDHDKQLTPMPSSSIRFYNFNGNYDQDGNPVYDSADSVYLDLSLPPESPVGLVAVNDIRLCV